MAVTTPTIANFNDCFAEMVKALGVADLNNPNGSVVAVGSPYSDSDIRKKLLDADYEIRLLICETQDHPFKELFYRNAETTDWLANYAFIPAGVADHSIAFVKARSAAQDSTKQKGILAKNLYEIEKIQKKPELFGSPETLFYVHAGRVYLAKKDALIQFDKPRLTQVANTLYSPLAYKWGVIALAITKCFVPGSNSDHRRYWAGMWKEYEARITGRANSLPEIEQLKRIGA